MQSGEGIAPYDQSSSEKESLGRETERRMTELLNTFLDDKRADKMPSDFDMLSSYLDGHVRGGGTLEGLAKDPHVFATEIFEKRYPEVEDRELLAAVLEKKYIDPESAFQKELYWEERLDEPRADIGRGKPKDSLVALQSMDRRANYIVKFLTLYNDEKVAEEEAEPTEAEREEMRQFREKLEMDMKIRAEGVIKKFEDTEVDLPGSNGSRIPLQEWAEHIAGSKFKTDLPYDAQEHFEKATAAFQTTFNRLFSGTDQKIIVDNLYIRMHQLQKELSLVKGQVALHETPEESQIKQKEKYLTEESRKADLLLKFIKYIITSSELPRL